MEMSGTNGSLEKAREKTVHLPPAILHASTIRPLLLLSASFSVDVLLVHVSGPCNFNEPSFAQFNISLLDLFAIPYYCVLYCLSECLIQAS